MQKSKRNKSLIAKDAVFSLILAISICIIILTWAYLAVSIWDAVSADKSLILPVSLIFALVTVYGYILIKCK